MAKRKTKPATAGEKVEMALLRRCNAAHPPTLAQFRTMPAFRGERAAARAHDRAIARAVKAEMDRCSAIVLYVVPRDQNRWIRNGWDPRKDDE